VYGTPHPNFIPTKEDYVGAIPTMGNRSCYDIGKQVLETLSHIYFNKHNSPVKVLRPFNLYGPHMGTKDNRVLSNWMNNALDAKNIKVYGNGSQTRTFCYAADGIAMALGVLLKGKSGEVYNIGTNTPELNMRELASKFLEGIERKGLLGLGNKIEVELISYPDDYPSDEPLRRCPNIDKTVRTTNIQPSTSLVDGIGRMFEYFKDQR
jgi:UDP-glucuronate decarboxylase